MTDDDLRTTLATACRVLFCQGHEHFYLGHVSARQLEGDGVWVKPTGLGLEEVGPGDMALMDLDGRQLAGERKLHTEMPIHTEIYKRRPDVNAVVHTHAFHAAALTSSDAPFELVSQDSIYFARGIGSYPSAELVESVEQGQRLAADLGDFDAVLMRNHGLAVVGPTIEQAVVRAVALERSCRLQLAAMQLGGVGAIPPDEARRMYERFAASGPRRDLQIWRYLVFDSGNRLDRIGDR